MATCQAFDLKSEGNPKNKFNTYIYRDFRSWKVMLSTQYPKGLYMYIHIFTSSSLLRTVDDPEMLYLRQAITATRPENS